MKNSNHLYHVSNLLNNSTTAGALYIMVFIFGWTASLAMNTLHPTWSLLFLQIVITGYGQHIKEANARCFSSYFFPSLKGPALQNRQVMITGGNLWRKAGVTLNRESELCVCVWERETSVLLYVAVWNDFCKKRNAAHLAEERVAVSVQRPGVVSSGRTLEEH